MQVVDCCPGVWEQRCVWHFFQENALKDFATLAQSLKASGEDHDEAGKIEDQGDMTRRNSSGLDIENDRAGLIMDDNLEPAMKASVWYYRGLGLERESDLTAALAAWRRSVKAEPQSTAAKAAAQCLSEHASRKVSHDSRE